MNLQVLIIAVVSKTDISRKITLCSSLLWIVLHVKSLPASSSADNLCKQFGPRLGLTKGPTFLTL